MSVSCLLILALTCFCFIDAEDEVIFLEEPAEGFQKIPAKSKNHLIPCVVNSSVEHCNWYLNDAEFTLDRNAVLQGNLTTGNCSLTLVRVEFKMNGTWYCNVTLEQDTTRFKISREGGIFVSKKPDYPLKINTIIEGKEKTLPSVLLVPKDTNETTITVVSSGSNPPEVENLIILLNDNPYNFSYDIQADDGANPVSYTILANVTVPVNSNIFAKHQHSANTGALKLEANLVIASEPKLYGNRIAIPRNTSYPLAIEGVPISAASLSSNKLTFEVKTKTGDPVKLEKNVIPGENKVGLTAYNITVTQKLASNEVSHDVLLEILRYDAMTNVTIVSPSEVTLSSESKTATLECTAEGDPQPEIYWLRYTGSSLYEYGKGSPISVTDPGIYKCAAVQTILEQQRLKEATTVVNVKA